jgi:CHAD domain-containing protein
LTTRSDGSWNKVARACKDLQKRASRWQLKHRQFDVLAAGIRDEYGRGREMMQTARQRQRDNDFHAWRKRLKGLWYDLRLFEEYDAGARAGSHRCCMQPKPCSVTTTTW